jgi:cell fate (sporulation/competence/biofilm development) regulator YlbF (YheA/YmcA/DUF963 family)
MATTQEILDAAADLGKLIARHSSAGKFNQAVKALQEDLPAQRALTDYQRHVSSIGEKEALGKPIEVEDKQKLETLQGQVIRTPVLRDFQLAQMDFLDLMRQVDAAISGPSDVTTQAPAASAIVNPDISS